MERQSEASSPGPCVEVAVGIPVQEGVPARV